MFELLGICLALASFFAINMMAALGVTAIWRVVERFANRWAAASRAQFLFAWTPKPGTAFYAGYNGPGVGASSPMVIGKQPKRGEPGRAAGPTPASAARPLGQGLGTA